MPTRFLKKTVANGLSALRRSPDACLPVLPVHMCSHGQCPSRPVTEMARGDRGVISCLTNPNHPRTARLAALGLLPGVQIQLVQLYPAYVVRIGYAQIAMDEELASLVRVLG